MPRWLLFRVPPGELRAGSQPPVGDAAVDHLVAV